MNHRTEEQKTSFLAARLKEAALPVQLSEKDRKSDLVSTLTRLFRVRHKTGFGVKFKDPIRKTWPVSKQADSEQGVSIATSSA